MSTKRPIEIEALIRWAYRDELSKRTTSSAEGIWDKISETGRAGIDPGHGAAQRYSHFGLPHPDAERIEKAVGALPNAIIDWDQEAPAVLGDLLALADPRSRKEAPASPARSPVARWTLGHGRLASVDLGYPREVILVRSLRTAALVTMHASMGNRPNWREEQPRPEMIARGSRAVVVGECEGKNRYSLGSYCPLRWSPSPIAIAEARADYLAWWRGLKRLAETLVLEDFQPLPIEAAEMPWSEPEPVWTLISASTPRKMPPLPLGPARKLAGPKKQYKRGGEVRYLGTGS